jgi:ribosomal protein L28
VLKNSPLLSHQQNTDAALFGKQNFAASARLCRLLCEAGFPFQNGKRAVAASYATTRWKASSASIAQTRRRFMPVMQRARVVIAFAGRRLKASAHLRRFSAEQLSVPGNWMEPGPKHVGIAPRDR